MAAQKADQSFSLPTAIATAVSAVIFPERATHGKRNQIGA